MQSPVYKDLVLVGGGHSHVAVLKAFGMRPVPGVRVTLISRHTETPYSGMLPGLIAGRYSFDEAHIDLGPLSRFAGARFVRGEVVGIDPSSGTVTLRDRPPIAYDVLSINTGSTPSTGGVTTEPDSLVAVKPIDRFLVRWNKLYERALNRDGPMRIGVVGGGAGSVELALAVQARLSAAHVAATIELITDGPEILMEFSSSVRRLLGDVLERRGIRTHLGTRVVAAGIGRLRSESGSEYAYDEVLWVTHAAAPDWIARGGLATDDEGFIAVNRFLQSTSHANVFAAGDVAAMIASPRPKSGVFAVRQGRPLAENLRRALLGRALVPYRPQRRFLRLIGTADGAAVASRGSWSFHGPLVWRWKDWIDRRFMRRYQVLPEMKPEVGAREPEVPQALIAERDAAGDPMRCGGCGAKVSSAVLDAALNGLETERRDDVLVGLDAPDDAALLTVPTGKVIAVSVDAFRPMIDDAYLFGTITANHCLNDLFAMGAEPQSALTIAALPVWPEQKLVDELRQMLAGALVSFSEARVALVGGHTSEASELSLGFSVTGVLNRDSVLGKTGFKPGDRLILTKGLGTGVILAADMRAKARGCWVDAAIASMCLSNEAAARCLHEHGAHACTDVTGFGLAGHLREMAGGTATRIKLDIDALPLLDGALDCVERGIRSTMQPKNEQALEQIDCAGRLRMHAAFPLLLDPQTAGGLVAAVPADQADACLTVLTQAGYADSALIGTVESIDGRGRVAFD
jgi:selenide,water dikinase